MNLVAEIAVSALIVIGGAFLLVGSIGLVKLPNLMMRLHAPTKATTLGVGSTLIASMLYFLFVAGTFSFHELSITIFLFLTAPITANFVAKAFLHASDDAQGTLPPSATAGVGWATFDPPRDGETP